VEGWCQDYNLEGFATRHHPKVILDCWPKALFRNFAGFRVEYGPLNKQRCIPAPSLRHPD